MLLLRIYIMENIESVRKIVFNAVLAGWIVKYDAKLDKFEFKKNLNTMEVTGASAPEFLIETFRKWIDPSVANKYVD